MKITIDTNEELSEFDQQILLLLMGSEVVEEEPEPEPEPVKPAAKKTTPAKKAAAKPEPAAEEPIADDDLIGEDDEVVEDDADDMSDEDLLALAIKRATEMVAGGKAADVRTALDAAGAGRVRELNTENVREFFKALS